jgi:hypothetical protein
MAYVFHLLQVVTFVYIWCRYSYFKNIQYCKYFECVIVHVISFSRTLKFIMCVPDPKMCIYVDKSATGSVPDLISPVCLIGKM